MVVDALELNMGDDLVQPRRSFTDPDDEDEDMLSSVRTPRSTHDECTPNTR